MLRLTIGLFLLLLPAAVIAQDKEQRKRPQADSATAPNTPPCMVIILSAAR